MTGGIPGFFEPNLRAFLGAHVPLGADQAGYYSTAPLRKTLDELVDFSLIIRAPAADRRCRACAHQQDALFRFARRPRSRRAHVMASGALPPAFPAVRIDGELYWDGGIFSNTPTERIFDDNPRRNSLIFAVHLWNPTGGAGDDLGGAEPAKGHPVFEPRRQPHHAAAQHTSSAT